MRRTVLDRAAVPRPGASCVAARDEAHRGGPSAVAPRWVAAVLSGLGLAMVPWIVLLHAGLPTTAHAVNWAWTWTGLDALEALGLTATGVLLLRRDVRACLTATACSALLVVDAWFDTMTAAPGADRTAAGVMAVGAELPLAVVCAVLAWRGVSGRAGRRRGPGSRTARGPAGWACAGPGGQRRASARGQDAGRQER